MLNSVKLLVHRYRGVFKRTFSKSISKKCLFGSGVQFLGLDNILIKDNCTIGDNTYFTINNRKEKDIQLIISSNVYVGRDCFFSVGKSIFIGDYSIFGNKCSFICSDHRFDNPLIPYALSGNSFNKSIRVGVNCWFGYDVTVIGNVSIGHGSIIGAKTVVTKNIPPFSMVVGNPGRIVKTYDFDAQKWLVGKLEIHSEFIDEERYLKYLKDGGTQMPLLYHSASFKFGDL